MKKFNAIILTFVAVFLSMSISAQNYALNFLDNGFSLKNTVTVDGINLNGNTSFTVEAWCNLTSYRENAPIVIKENGGNCGMEYVAFYLFVDATGLPGLGIGNGTDFLTTTSTISIPLNEWHHIAGTWDGNTVKVYVDGVEAASETVTGAMWDEGAEMNIGNRWDCIRRSIDGIIDELRLWNDTRTEAEIIGNMNNELSDPASETDLIAYYMFNQGSGDIAYDSGTNGYNGMLGGVDFPSGYTSAPQWVISTFPILDDCLVLDLGGNQVVYFGYNPMECALITANVTEGTPPYTYLWNTGETGESIEVCPEENTVYSVAVTDANQCSATEDVLVEVMDVRCGWRNNKVLVCHTSFWNPEIQYTLCVRSWLASLLLYFGDELGSCDWSKSTPVIDEMPDFANVDEVRDFDQKFYEENFNAGDIATPITNELTVYPNPIMGLSKISFEVSMNEQTTVEIVNSLGQVVESLFNEVSQSDKIYTLEFNAQKFNTGIYFVRLVNGNDVMQKKISIIK